MDIQSGVAPWDDIQFYAIPTETVIIGTGLPQQVCAANPNRVGIIFATQSGGPVAVSTNPGTLGIQGITLSASTGPFPMFKPEYGSLVNVAWFTNIAMLTQLTVFELVANRWPTPADARSIREGIYAQRLPKSTYSPDAFQDYRDPRYSDTRSQQQPGSAGAINNSWREYLGQFWRKYRQRNGSP